jgi:hypothetical protein
MIYYVLRKEYAAFINNRAVKYSESIKLWNEFIQKKNLGIICIKATQVPYDDIYKIVDEKKWLLAKIKYGF